MSPLKFANAKSFNDWSKRLQRIKAKVLKPKPIKAKARKVKR